MKLLGARLAANPRRVSIYLAEKNLFIEQVHFEPPYSELKSPEFLAKNPSGKMPVLELHDGTCISESAAIVEYLEELYPEPPMIGRDPLQRAQVRALERVAADLFNRLALLVQHSNPSFMQSRGMIAYADVVNALEPSVRQLLCGLEARIGERVFLAGPEPTVADCSLYALLYACRAQFGYSIPDDYPRLRAWYDRFSDRPSAQP